tara:strand:- start:1659 stop:1901 length:243 start_codon:yes stop_codon:yes gene_type:complete
MNKYGLIQDVNRRMLNVEDRLRLAHESVCKAENKRMREVFDMRTYKEGDQWTAQRNSQAIGAKGGRQKNLNRLWVKERTL